MEDRAGTQTPAPAFPNPFPQSSFLKEQARHTGGRDASVFCSVFFNWIFKENLEPRQEKRRDAISDGGHNKGWLWEGKEGKEETGMVGMVEVKVREAGCNDL